MNTNHVIDFRVLPGGDVQATFAQLKALQTLGIADKRSSIKFNGITLPAGLFETFEEYFQFHYTLAAKQLSDIESILPSNITSRELYMLLNAVTRECQELGIVGFTEEEMDAMLKKAQQEETSHQK